MAGDNQGGVDDGNLGGRALEGQRLLTQLVEAIGDLGRRESGQDGRRHERGANDEGAEGNHFGGCLKFGSDTWSLGAQQPSEGCVSEFEL